MSVKASQHLWGENHWQLTETCRQQAAVSKVTERRWDGWLSETAQVGPILWDWQAATTLWPLPQPSPALLLPALHGYRLAQAHTLCCKATAPRTHEDGTSTFPRCTGVRKEVKDLSWNKKGSWQSLLDSPAAQQVTQRNCTGFILGVFRTQLDKALSNIIWPQSWACFSRDLPSSLPTNY